MSDQERSGEGVQDRRVAEELRGGRVDLVGAGPGDPGLITVLGAACLRDAQVVVYDHLVHPALLDLAPVDAARVFAGKRAGRVVLAQSEIEALLEREARAGKRVVRLKGGDPYVFGRGGEEARFLAERGIPFRVVPGVTAGVGATSWAGVPLTLRGVSSCAVFATGHEEPASGGGTSVDWEALGGLRATLVIYMGLARLRSLCERLMAGGRSGTTPAVAIRWGTMPGQEVVEGTLETLADRVAERGLEPPVLVVVGEVVGLRRWLGWAERRPLAGQVVVVTRPAEELGAACRELELLGAEALGAPMVTIGGLRDHGPLDGVIAELSGYDWLVFTSARGVRSMLERIWATGRDLRVLGGLKLAAIGPATAEALAAARLRADVVPKRYESEDLAAELRDRVRGQRVLLARASRGREVLRQELEGVAARVDQVAVYEHEDAEALPEPIWERLEAGEVDWVVLTSSAIAARFGALAGPRGREWIQQGRTGVVVISRVTAEAAGRAGLKVSCVAGRATWSGVVEALVAGVEGSRGKNPRSM